MTGNVANPFLSIGGTGSNDFNSDHLSSVSDSGDTSDINDILEILHRQNTGNTLESSGRSSVNFDSLLADSFGLDAATPLMNEVLRQFPPVATSADRRSASMSGNGGHVPHGSSALTDQKNLVVSCGQDTPDLMSGTNDSNVALVVQFYFAK
jgi:hypothetical protein